MATFRERLKADGSRVFHVQVRQAGFPARTATFPTRRLAERWAKTVEAEMIEGRHFRSAEARRRTLAAAIDRYIAEEIPKKKGGEMHRSCLPWWREKIGALKLAEVTPAVLVEYRGRLARETYTRANPKAARSSLRKGQKPKEYLRSSATINRYVACLSHVFTVARKEWHWISHDPFDGVSMLREGRGDVRYLSESERTALLRETAKDPVLHTFVLLALSTACRAGELLKLTWRDVDLAEGRLLFREPKNDEGRATWLHGKALQLLTEHAKARPGVPELGGEPDDDARVFQSPTGAEYDYYTPFTDAVAAANVKAFKFHHLRHSAATYLAMEGASEQQLRAIGGWKSGVVRRYVHIAAKDAKAALEKLASKIDGEA